MIAFDLKEIIAGHKTKIKKYFLTNYQLLLAYQITLIFSAFSQPTGIGF